MVGELAPGDRDAQRWLGLFHQVQARNPEAFRQLCGEMRPRLKAEAKNLCSSQASGSWDASDVVQDCLLKVWEHAADVHATTDPQVCSWISAIVRNESLTRVRNEKRHVRDVRRQVRLPEDSCGGVSLESKMASPSWLAERWEEEDSLRAAISRMGPDDQMVFRLWVQERLKWSEVAERMGRTEAAVRQRYSRLLKQLKEMMGGA